MVRGDGEHHALPALPLELHHLAPLLLPELQLLAITQLLHQLELLLRGEQHLAAMLVKEDVLLAGFKHQLLLLLLLLYDHVLWLLLYEHVLWLLLFHYHLLLRLNVHLLLPLLLSQKELLGLLLTQHQSLLRVWGERLLWQEVTLAPDVDDLTSTGPLDIPGGQLGGGRALDDLHALSPLSDLGSVGAGDLDVGSGGHIEHLKL